MMKIICLIIALLITTFLTKSQEIIPYNWEENRDLYKINTADSAEKEIILKNYVRWQYGYDAGISSVFLYITIHKIVKVNNNDAIQRNNKIYISTYDLIDIVDLKARALDKDGKEYLFNNENIKEIKEDNETGYKIFAIEGAGIGGEIEYLYTKKIYADYFGRLYAQEKVPVYNFQFDLVCPLNLNFKFRMYNGEMFSDTSITDSNLVYRFKAENVMPLYAEEFSYYNPNRQRIEFKMSHNYAITTNEINTWDDAAQRIYEMIYSFTKPEMKSLLKLYKQLKINRIKSEKEKIKAIENFIKTHFYMQENGASQLSNINFILANSVGNKKGLVRLYAGLLRLAKINHEIVLTSPREQAKFDADFDTWNYLISYLIYFPDLEEFLTPEESEFRLGMVPWLLTETKGLFLQRVTGINTETAIARISIIPTLSFNKNIDDLYIDIKIDSGFEKSIIKIKREIGGNNAIYIQPYFSFLEEEQKTEVLKNIMKTSAVDAKFISISAENYELNTSLIEKPFIINAEMETSSLIEYAGDKIIFKIGDVIAEQTELYQDKERQTDVENDFNRSYYREINFEIPQGYEVKNTEPIKMNYVYEKNGKHIYAFISNYEIIGNTLKIVVDEYYKEIICEKENFEEFRKVVNAAADFNKLVLVLVKNRK